MMKGLLLRTLSGVVLMSRNKKVCSVTRFLNLAPGYRHAQMIQVTNRCYFSDGWRVLKICPACRSCFL